MNCCLQVRDCVRHLFLITEDVNLYNKASASKIIGLDPKEAIQKLDTKLYGIDAKKEKPLGSTYTYIPTERNDIDLYNNIHTQTAANFGAYNNLKIHIDGFDVPNQIESFHNSGLHPHLLDVLVNNMKFIKPTPVQQVVIPIVMAKRDLIACSQTGSGKTATYLIPIINDILTNNRPITYNKPFAVITSPTRELSNQVLF